ncbi:MAG: hypothetical protein ACOYIP_04340 [Coriobacteriales bacterium]|jgi:hypothetical protein
MKKITLAVLVSLVAVLAMVALVGCGGGSKQQAIDAYKEAVANNAQNAQDMNFDATLTAKADMSGTDLLNIDGTMKVQYKLPDGITLNTNDAKAVVDAIDKIDMLVELDLEMNAMGESTDLGVGIYATDGKMYMDLVAPDTDPTKVSFEVTPEMKQQILDSVDEMMASSEGSSNDIAALAEQFPIEKYVKDGSVGDGTINLTLDLFKMIDDVAAKQAESGDTSLAESLQSIDMLKKALSNGDMYMTCKVNADNQITAMNISMDTDIDLGALTGEAAGASSEQTKMHFVLNLDVPTYEINSGKDVKFPSFSGYEDLTDEMNDGLESAMEVVPDKVEANQAA